MGQRLLAIWKSKRLRAALLVIAVLAVAFCLWWAHGFWGFPFQRQRHTRVPLTPPWALECWLWEDDANTAAKVEELLAGYKEHDIPVTTILIDSPWSTRYNDFVVDTSRYPEPDKFFPSLQQRGYRAVLWMTCMVNSRSSDTAAKDGGEFFAEAKRQGFLAGQGREIRWWKGKGAFIDYTNPRAVAWWHGLQQQVLGWGIDGWKLDGTDTLFATAGCLPFQRTHAGLTTTREYMDLYAREEYRHGLTKNPEFIVLVRAIDNRYYPLSHPEGFAPLDAAPVTWVGDRVHEWSSKGGSAEPGRDAMRDKDSQLDRGFEGALRDILASAKLGYGVVGDDVGGYHGREPIPPRLYIRWAQFAAFTGLFLNGGHGERALWKRSREELEIIRKYSWMHTELVPYLFSQLVRQQEGGPALMRPVKGQYHYLLGDNLLVAPIYRDQLTNTVELPAGRWRHWFRDQEVIPGPATLTQAFALDDFPVFVRDGAIIPLNVSRPYTGFGDAESKGYDTWLVYPAGQSEFTLNHPDRSGATTLRVNEGNELTLTFSGVRKPHLLRIHRATEPHEVLLDGKPLAKGEQWSYDASAQRLSIRTRSYFDGEYVVR
jgi:alpha-glucosidase (family GH31 glycosyl hydrolase)